MRTFPLRQALAPSLALALALSACQAPSPTAPEGSPAASTAPSGGDAAPLANLLMGRAYLGEAMAGATIKVWKTDGTLLKEYPNATNALGAFAVSLPEAVANFRVEAHPPAGAPTNQNGVAAAEVRGFSPERNVVYLDPVTTVISHSVKTKGEGSLEAAKANARVLFNLGPDNDLNMDLDLDDEFDEPGFMAEAARQGGFSAHIATTANNLGVANATKPPMVKNFVVGAAKDAAKAIVMKAGKALAKKAEGTPVVGWVLNQVFVSAEDKFREETAAALENIQNELKGIKDDLRQQREQLVEISNRLEALQGEVSFIKNRLVAFETRTSRQLGSVAYNNTINSVQRDLARIDALYDQLVAFSQLDPKQIDKPTVRLLRDSILTEMPTIIDHLFKAEFENASGGDTAMSQWQSVAGYALSENFPNMVPGEYIARLHAQEEFFATYEARALILLIDALHSTDNPQVAEAERQFNQVVARLDKQKAAVSIPEATDSEKLSVSPKQGLLWWNRPWSPTGQPAQEVYTYTSATKAITPSDPRSALANEKLAGMSGWRLPTSDEVHSMGPNPDDPKKQSGPKKEGMAALGFPFDYASKARTIWTSTAFNGTPIVFDLDQGFSTTGYASNFIVFHPVRTIPVYNK